MQYDTFFYRFRYPVLILTLLLGGLILLVNSKGILLNCFHVMDFGIYQQAIYEIVGSFDLNPYLTVRDIKIFNDHVDPVLFLAAPFVWVSNFHPVSLIIFEFLWFLLLFGYVWKKDENGYWPYFFLLIIFSKGMLTGIGYPIHPTTWSLLPAFALGRSIIRDERKTIVLLSLFLIFFKESFAFAVFGLSGYYLLKKEFKMFGTLMLISISSMIFTFKLRPLLLGPVYPHANTVLSGFPWSLINKLISVDVKAFLKVFYPFFIPLFFIIQNKIRRKEWLPRELGVLFYIFPLFLIQWLADKIHFQYALLIVSPLLALIFYSTEREAWLSNRKVRIATLLFFVASSMGTHTKNVRAAFDPKNKSCSFAESRVESIKEVNKFFADKKGPIMSTGGAIPRFLKPGMKVYQAGLFRQKLDSYNYMLIEKPGTGNHYPYTNEQISRAIKICQNEEKIIDDEWFLLIKNPSEKCFKTIQ